MSIGEARIHERGYRTYDGERTGVLGAVRALVVNSAQRALGLGRPVRHKVMPAAVMIMAYLPGAAFVGAAALIPGELEDEFLPSYADYYGFISAALFLFAAFVAPELLSTDRRTGMLGVYLASPLDRRTYLLAKAIAVFGLLSIVTLGPPLLLLIALSLEGSGPDSWTEGLRLAVRIFASSMVMSAVFAAVSLAVSATTERQIAATATIIGLLVGTTALASILEEGADLPDSIRLISLIGVPVELNYRIHGELGEWRVDEVPTWSLWLAVFVVVTGSTIWIWDRYRRLVVRR